MAFMLLKAALHRCSLGPEICTMVLIFCHIFLSLKIAYIISYGGSIILQTFHINRKHCLCATENWNLSMFCSLSP